MVSSVMEVNTGTLRTDAASIRMEIQAMKQGADDLRRMAGNLNRMWEGTAKTAFLAGYEQELAALENSIRALEQYTSMVEASSTAYDRGERAVADVVASIRV